MRVASLLYIIRLKFSKYRKYEERNEQLRQKGEVSGTSTYASINTSADFLKALIIELKGTREARAEKSITSTSRTQVALTERKPM